MTQLYAQPYDITASGFYFETAAEYEDKASKLRNSYGQPVEEFELQFIDGEGIASILFSRASSASAAFLLNGTILPLIMMLPF